MNGTARLIGVVALSLCSTGAQARAQAGGETGAEGQAQEGQQGQQGQEQGQGQAQQGQQGEEQGQGQGGAGTQAQQTQQPGVPPTPSAQDQAIQPLFGRGGTWTGQVPAGARGANSPATTTEGRADCRAIAGGLWYTCDIEDRIAPGSPDSVDLLAHMTVGYDRSAQGYQATIVDNQGSAMRSMNGNLSGTRFVLETPRATTSRGVTAKNRLTFDFSDPNNIAYTAERQLPGQDWTVLEKATIHPRTARQAQASTPG
jgi:hypothetical protein